MDFMRKNLTIDRIRPEEIKRRMKQNKDILDVVQKMTENIIKMDTNRKKEDAPEKFSERK